ncbi:MAG: DNA-directed RNA polymerase subunit B [Candidatus Diapherotrites archaeon]|nr:DNA-directed RNA polymerase subunit B [Candidatus Diapherotrites archaeon]
MAEIGKVYINGRLIGFHESPEKLTQELIKSRRSGKISHLVNVALNRQTNEVYINTDSGRVQRPLIIVENGRPLLTDEHVRMAKEGKFSWNDLISKGIIEYLDSEEEENAFVAVSEDELSNEHTHLEIDASAVFSLITSMIPYLTHNMAGKALHGAKMFKQALGIPAINMNLRTDTEGFLLYYPQSHLVKTKVMDFIGVDKRPQNQNFVVAIMPFYSFNVLDALVLNEGSVERGLGRAAYYRTYDGTENRYPGGQKDKLEIPAEDVEGYLGEDAYKNLGEDGLVRVEAEVKEKEIIVGRTSPPRFLEEISEFGVVKEKRRESSVITRKGKPGYVDKVIVTESEDGNKLIKVKVRTEMSPERGDKFSSRHGQKGVIGGVIPEADMPFTAEGIKPDLIINPHSIPSRMTIGHLLEMIAGKAGSLKSKAIDGTAFNETPLEALEGMLSDYGFRSDGKEVFYDGVSGERLEGEIFVGVCGYRRLFHMVAHKMQSRSRGPVQILTRQPTEGKEKEGGLRFGEMEAETLVGHGAAMLLQEKLIESSDKTVEYVCERCGVLAVNDVIRNKRFCPLCDSARIYPIEMSYSFKLLLDELKALGVFPKLIIKDKV